MIAIKLENSHAHSALDHLIDELFLLSLLIYKTVKLKIFKIAVLRLARRAQEKQTKLLNDVIKLSMYVENENIPKELFAELKDEIEPLCIDMEDVVEQLRGFKGDSQEMSDIYDLALKLETELAFLQAKL